MTIAPAKSCHAACLGCRRCQSSEIDALRLVVVAELLKGAVNIDGPVIAGIAQHADDPLRLAERIGTDEMRALGELFDGFQKLGDLVAAVGVAEDRQREGRFGDEDIASDGFETEACRIGAALVVARGDDAHAVLLHSDLRRTEHMACGVKTHADTIDFDGFAKLCSLCFTGEIRAVAQAHDVERLLRRHHLAVAGAGMVGMAMGDQCTLDGTNRIDMEITGRGIEAGRRRTQQSFGTFQQDIPRFYHLTNIGRIWLRAILTNNVLAL